MPEHRLIYARDIVDAGLTAPDDPTMALLEQIVDEGVLGASNHIRLTHDLLMHLMAADSDAGTAWLRTEMTASFVARVRGAQAPVVNTAIQALILGLDRLEPVERLETLKQRIGDWKETASSRRKRLVDHAVTVLRPVRRLIPFDYSSTVADIVIAVWSDAGADKGDREIIVPESRAISGGLRYVEAFTRAGIPVHMALDAAFEQILQPGSAVLFGAESLRADGSLTNTIGSRPLARLAQWSGIDVYGCTDLSKLDLRSYAGPIDPPSIRQFDLLVAEADLPPTARVRTDGPELEVVPPDLITALLTEHGAVPPAGLWNLGRREFGDQATIDQSNTGDQRR
jgi:translation initiation factor 2B subunit (eIF-2B alpha/beta/delta family)